MSDEPESLVSLRTTLVDASAGYDEGATLTENQQIRAVLLALRELHNLHLQELTVAMTARGVAEPEEGSVMTTVHKAILNLRALVTGLDENILPGLIDGEERIIAEYREVVAEAATDRVLSDLLQAQCQRLEYEIVRLKELRAKL